MNDIYNNVTIFHQSSSYQKLLLYIYHFGCSAVVCVSHWACLLPPYRKLRSIFFTMREAMLGGTVGG